MIDKSTVQQIIDAADIVEVVSDFVNLKRRGANYVGLCPFHNEKTPSFSVSKAKGICKCFSCGKGGSPVNFIMEHEQLSYYEALKFLANKYHIEIKERELTDKEKEAQSERESMLFINEFASKFFEDNLFKTTEGNDIGLSYFRERGFNDTTIKKFHLGYSLDVKDSLYKATINEGLKEKFIFDTGLCIQSNYGGGYDRFKGRVMFPVLNIAGKVVAFGGRTLKKDPAKYVNSPESIVYKKSNELYGLFQAKQSIVKKEKCFLVEGYTDVLSMHQAGIENVVASSGTSLTEGQIRMIHRFTDNVTVLYDGDSAGIKASLRGIDMLLAEGLNIKVLLLPEGEDPDSFAKAHSASEFQDYISEYETDFIQFKTKILLEGTSNDPIKKSAVIQDIVKSISVIPFQIMQSVYTKECSRLLDIDEQVLVREIAKTVLSNKEKEFETKAKADREALKNEFPDNDSKQQANIIIQDKVANTILLPYETEVIRFIIKYGMAQFCIGTTETGDNINITIVEYIKNELTADGITFSDKLYADIFTLCCNILTNSYQDFENKQEELSQWRKAEIEKGINEIRAQIIDLDTIRLKENNLNEEVDKQYMIALNEFRCNYIERILCSYPDDAIRKKSIDLISEKHKLSKIHTKYSAIPTEYSRLIELIPMSINNWKNGIVNCRILEIRKQLASAGLQKNAESLLLELQDLYAIKSQLANILGERVVNPRK